MQREPAPQRIRSPATGRSLDNPPATTTRVKSMPRGPAADAPGPAIEIRAVTYRYPGPGSGAAPGATPAGSDALSDINLIVERGERLGIVGPNGGGKSTLLSLVTGMRPLQIGTVRVLGDAPERARDRGQIGYVAQRSEADRRFPISVRQAVEMPLRVRTAPWRRLTRTGRDRAQHALGLVDLAELADRPVDAMSGGQFQRLLIARAVVTQPEILVLDEPTVGIDVAGQQRFAALIDRLVTELGLTILIVSHDLRAIAAGCDRVACLARTLHYHDAPGGLTPAVLAEVFHHDLVGVFGADNAGGAAAHTHTHQHTHACGGCSPHTPERSSKPRAHDQANGPADDAANGGAP